MTDTWYYAEEGRAVGPFTLHDLKAALAKVPDWNDSFVWRDGFSEWQKAGGIAELAGLVAAPPARPAPQPVRDRAPAKRWSAGKVLSGIGLVAAVVIGAAFGKVIGRTVYDFATGFLAATTPLTLDARLARYLEGFEATLPRKVDDLTTLVSAKAEGSTVIFGFRLEFDGGELDDETKAKLREVVTRDACTEHRSRDLLDAGGSFRFGYADGNGKTLATVDVDGRDCR